MHDWRGEPLSHGDTVVWPYGWGGQSLSLCEGVVVKQIDTDRVEVDIHYDNGDYPRRRTTVRVPCERLTKVSPRLEG